jgi:hypothetical protein
MKGVQSTVKMILVLWKVVLRRGDVCRGVEFFEGSGAGQKAKIHPDIAKTMISLGHA